MTNKELSKLIIRNLGTKSNIKQAWHCITRLRFYLYDDKLVDLAKLKSLPGVLDVKFQGDQLQVIIGNKVDKVYVELKNQLGDVDEKIVAENQPKTNSFNPINAFFGMISGIFNPILPAIVGAGVLKGILALLVFLTWLTPESSEYFFLNIISDASFYFLPFLIASSASKKFNVNQYLSMALAGIMMYPSFAALAGDPGSFNFFFLKIPALDYSSSVIPIILGVYLLSQINKLLNKVIPDLLKLIFVPLLSLLIVAPIQLFLLAPLGNYIGIYVAAFFIFLFSVAGPVAGLLMGALLPLLVMTGMHYALFPSTFESFASVGYDIILLPMNLASNIAQCGATFAAAIKLKDKNMKSVAYSSAVSAIFGVTEPAMYGVTLKYKKPFYAAMVGGSIGGAIYGFFTVKSFAFSIPGITALPTYIEPGTNNFLIALIGVLLSFGIAFVLTLVMPLGEDSGSKTIAQPDLGTIAKSEQIDIVAPITGTTMPLAKVADSVFSTEVLGQGIAIVPSEGKVYAPFDGKISTVAETGHALGLISTAGIEMLIHVGLDTVALAGKGFNVLVKENDHVKQGDLLMEFDLDIIISDGFAVTTPIVITNSAEFGEILVRADYMVTANQDVIISIK